MMKIIFFYAQTIPITPVLREHILGVSDVYMKWFELSPSVYIEAPYKVK